MTIVTLTGPSCAGKSTLEQLLVKASPRFKRVISHTTREPRAGEKNGDSYFFVTKEEFQELRDDGAFVEVVEFGGNFYGATRQQFIDILTSGNHAVIVVEPNGRDAIIDFAEKEGLAVMPVFITNPSDVLASRFVQRMLADFARAMSKPESGESERVLRSYSGRLGVMLSEEAEWQPSTLPTSLTFGKFDDSNESFVMGRVMAGADACPAPRVSSR